MSQKCNAMEIHSACEWFECKLAMAMVRANCRINRVDNQKFWLIFKGLLIDIRSQESQRVGFAREPSKADPQMRSFRSRMHRLQKANIELPANAPIRQRRSFKIT